MISETAVIEFRNLDFAYDQSPILRNLTGSVIQGRFTALLGPNGSGKTTLLKTMLKILKPERRTVFIDGQDIRDFRNRELARITAYVPQFNAMSFRFSVKDVVLMGRHPYLRPMTEETTADHRIVEDAMRATGVWRFRDKNIDEVSGGEAQRILIARALAQEPQILILDEPTSHLDLQYQLEILNLIDSLKKDTGLTVIAVLHDVNHAIQYADSVILLREGELFASGPASEVLTSETIRSVYHIDVDILKHPENGRKVIVPAAPRQTCPHSAD